MENTQKENLKLFCNNYHIGNLKIKWELVPMGKTKCKFYGGKIFKKLKAPLYKAKFYNPKNKNKIYHMTLYLLFIRGHGKSKIYIEGNLSEWYYQMPLGRKLSSVEYYKCLDFLLEEIGDVGLYYGVEEYDEEKGVNGISEEFNNILMCIDKHKKYESKRRAKFEDGVDITQMKNIMHNVNFNSKN